MSSTLASLAGGIAFAGQTCPGAAPRHLIGKNNCSSRSYTLAEHITTPVPELLRAELAQGVAVVRPGTTATRQTSH